MTRYHRTKSFHKFFMSKNNAKDALNTLHDCAVQNGLDGMIHTSIIH